MKNTFLYERGSRALLSRWRTSNGLPRFEPLAVNNARTELPVRPCMYIRRSTAVNQATALHGEHTMPSASPHTHTHTACTFAHTHVHTAKRSSEQEKTGLAVCTSCTRFDTPDRSPPRRPSPHSRDLTLSLAVYTGGHTGSHRTLYRRFFDD